MLQHEADFENSFTIKELCLETPTVGRSNSKLTHSEFMPNKSDPLNQFYIYLRKLNRVATHLPMSQIHEIRRGAPVPRLRKSVSKQPEDTPVLFNIIQVRSSTENHYLHRNPIDLTNQNRRRTKQQTLKASSMRSSLRTLFSGVQNSKSKIPKSKSNPNVKINNVVKRKSVADYPIEKRLKRVVENPIIPSYCNPQPLGTWCVGMSPTGAAVTVITTKKRRTGRLIQQHQQVDQSDITSTCSEISTTTSSPQHSDRVAELLGLFVNNNNDKGNDLNTIECFSNSDCDCDYVMEQLCADSLVSVSSDGMFHELESISDGSYCEVQQLCKCPSSTSDDEDSEELQFQYTESSHTAVQLAAMLSKETHPPAVPRKRSLGYRPGVPIKEMLQQRELHKTFDNFRR